MGTLGVGACRESIRLASRVVPYGDAQQFSFCVIFFPSYSMRQHRDFLLLVSGGYISSITLTCPTNQLQNYILLHVAAFSLSYLPTGPTGTRQLENYFLLLSAGCISPILLESHIFYYFWLHFLYLTHLSHKTAWKLPFSTMEQLYFIQVVGTMAISDKYKGSLVLWLAINYYRSACSEGMP